MEDSVINKKQFDALAKNVNGAYPDFINNLYSCAKNCGCVDEVYDFMENNPVASTGEVLEVIDNILGNPDPMNVLQETKPSLFYKTPALA